MSTNSCIVLVMHQNKGRDDTNMKGYLGTLLNQKCSDVWSMVNHGGVFIASHSITRHRQAKEILFCINDNGEPCDGTQRRAEQREAERQAAVADLREMLAPLFGDFKTMKRSELAKKVAGNGISMPTAY